MFNRRPVISVGVVLLLLRSCALLGQASPTPATNQQQRLRISGTVVNAAGGQPIAGVEVFIATTHKREDPRQVFTGPDGRFVFDNLSRGKYSLGARHRGFVAQAYQQHDQYSTAIAVGPDLVSEGLVFPLVPEGSISGMVVDEENETVRTGEAMLFNRGVGAGGSYHLLTRIVLDDQGHYHFGHLSPGSYLVAVSAQPWYAQDPQASPKSETPATDTEAPAEQARPDIAEAQASALDVAYPTTLSPSATEADNAAPIELHPGERATADIAVHAVPAAHVRVRNGSLDPASPLTAIVEQRLFDTQVQLQARNQEIDSGALTLTGIPPGHFNISIRNFTGKEWTILNKELDVSGDTEINAAEDTTGMVSVKGVVHVDGNTPFPTGAFIRFSNHESGDTFGAQVNEKGEFEFQGYPGGRSDYGVAVFNVPAAVLQSISAKGAQVSGHTVVLPRTGTVQVDVFMSTGLARVNGTVTRDEKPASEAMVLLVPEHLSNDAPFFRRDQSDSDGTFSLYEILPGRYIAVAIEKGWELDWQNPSVLKPYLELGSVVEVAANKTYEITLKLQAQGTPVATPPEVAH